jgi:hypothetical protein
MTNDDEGVLTGLGYPPEGIARIRTQGSLLRALEALDEAVADADGLDPRVGDAVNGAVRPARADLIRALHACEPES